MDSEQPSAMQLPRPGLTAYAGGIVAMKPLSQLLSEERDAALVANSRPYITNLAAHVRQKWEQMRNWKQSDIEPRLLQCVRQRRGEYDPEKAAQIKQQGGADIYMMLSSNKARAASSWIRDVTTDAEGGPLPYYITPTPDPEPDPARVEELKAQIRTEIQQAMMVGMQPSMEEVKQFVMARNEMMLAQLREEARAKTERMKRKMDDQLIEGGCAEEFKKFVDDLATFPYAVMKGPVVKKRRSFKWAQAGDGSYVPELTESLVPTWERVDPFMLYWESHAAYPDDSDLIERHRLKRSDLNQMIGVEGYNEEAIRAVLHEHGRGGLNEWLWIDAAKATAEGKSQSGVMSNDGGLIDALQFWGSVQGTMLIEWGLDEAQVEDPLLDYEVEVWLIGQWVIKAVVNPDPMGRKIYYKTSYEEIPGAWCGNGVMDLVRDCQDVCNAAARALVNNMGIASGPQVWVHSDRLPPGESITKLYPWKVHQVVSDPYGNGGAPIGFFQPNSMAAELMGVYDKWSVAADEYSGLPRYMSGDTAGSSSMRTASQTSIMMNNAGKSIKQVVGNIDLHVTQPMIERLWFFNMKYSDDPELKGDVSIVARGANAMMVKESAAQRRNEFLQMTLASPVVQQILGMEGTAHLLREQVKTLDMNADKLIPAPEIVRARAAVAQAQQAQQMAMQAQQAGANGPVSQSGQQLQDGTPITDNFSPMRQ